MRVALDRGHAGKGPGSGDRGASSDLDGDGQVETHEREAMLTPAYILAAEHALLLLGHEVICLSDGSYAARQARAIGYGCDVYVACHLNAGSGDYGLAVHNPGSVAGRALATAITGKLRVLCPELARVVVGEAREGSFPRAAACIGDLARAKPIGIVYEPWFLDQPAHHGLATGGAPTRVGQALAEGIDAWARSRA